MADLEPVRLRAWLATSPNRSIPLDDIAHERIADALLDALNAAGGPEHNYSRYVALTKALAMMMGAATIDQTPDDIAAICDEFSAELCEQILTFRAAAVRDASKKRRTQ